jgi:hypothetical protein
MIFGRAPFAPGSWKEMSIQSPAYRRVRVGESHSELLVDPKDFHTYAVGWSGITPEGLPLFVRDVSSDEIYALDLELP